MQRPTPMIIVDLGVNHNGDLKLVLEMITACKEAGADIVKFQKRTINKVYKDSHLDSISYDNVHTWREIWSKWELRKKDYNVIDKHCRSLDISWTASVWDKESVDFILDYDVPFLKISSACITDIPLLEYVKATGKDVFMSTGMSNMENILVASNILNPSFIMHCTSSYPTPDLELNLAFIHNLQQLFPDTFIGFSSHTDIFPSQMAMLLGAMAIEHHVTLSKTMEGPDQSASIDMEELKILCSFAKKCERCVDCLTGEYKSIYDSELDKIIELRGYQNV